MSEKRCVLALSGGMDSSTLLYHLLERDWEVSCLAFDYGQRHKKELECARQIGRCAGVQVSTVNLGDMARVIFPTECLTGGPEEVPDGPFTGASMRVTAVPNLAMILISICAGHAISIGAKAPSGYHVEAYMVAFGCHKRETWTYPDNRVAFTYPMIEVLSKCYYEPVELLTPFVGMSKQAVLRKGLDLHVPFHRTWTCYNGIGLPCGKCGACMERLEAFRLNGRPDPLKYRDESGCCG